MSIDDTEYFKALAETTFSILYAAGQQSMTYNQFCHALELTYHFKIDDLVKAAKFHCGKDFMQFLGFEFNDDGDLIIRPLEEREGDLKMKNLPEEITESYGAPISAAAATVEPPQDVPPAKKHEIYVFDGDERKLHPGMYVRISTGMIHTLPSIPSFPEQNAFTRKLQMKAGLNYRKRVRHLVEMHEKMNKVLEITNHRGKTVSNNNTVST